MPCVRVVGRNHEGACHGARESLCVARGEHGAETFHDGAQQRRVGALLGAGAGLLVVEDGHHACCRSDFLVVGGGEQSFERGESHREVIDASRLEELVVQSAERRRLGGIEAQLIFQYVGNIDAEFLGDGHLHDAAFAFLAFYLFRSEVADHRFHVLLHREGIAFVYGAVEVYGEMRDESHGAAHVKQAAFGVQRVGGSEHHAAGNREGTVKPGVEDAASVFLDVERHHASLAVNLGVGFDFEAGGVAVRRDDAESGLCGIAGADDEGHDGRAVLDDVTAVAGTQFPVVALFEFAETAAVELAAYAVHCQEVAGGAVEVFQKSLYHIGYQILIIVLESVEAEPREGAHHADELFGPHAAEVFGAIGVSFVEHGAVGLAHRPHEVV